MSSQLVTAFSSLISSAGIFAGGPPYCSDGLFDSGNRCDYHPEFMDVDHIAHRIRQFSISELIDSTVNLAGKKIYTYSGKSDTRVVPGVVHKTAEVFEKFGANVKRDFEFDSAHTMPTLDYGSECL